MYIFYKNNNKYGHTLEKKNYIVELFNRDCAGKSHVFNINVVKNPQPVKLCVSL